VDGYAKKKSVCGVGKEDILTIGAVDMFAGTSLLPRRSTKGKGTAGQIDRHGIRITRDVNMGDERRDLLVERREMEGQDIQETKEVKWGKVERLGKLTRPGSCREKNTMARGRARKRCKLAILRCTINGPVGEWSLILGSALKT